MVLYEYQERRGDRLAGNGGEPGEIGEWETPAIEENRSDSLQRRENQSSCCFGGTSTTHADDIAERLADDMFTQPDSFFAVPDQHGAICRSCRESMWTHRGQTGRRAVYRWSEEQGR
jgi:hypothetical protein